MRKWFYLITEHPDDDMIGLISADSTRPYTTATKNEEGTRRKWNRETDERYVQKEVGLGYHDFEDEEDYEDRCGDVIDAKLDDIDDAHLEKAGVLEVVAG